MNLLVKKLKTKNKYNFLRIKFRNREIKVWLIRLLSKNWNIYLMKRLKLFREMIVPGRKEMMRFVNLRMLLIKKEEKVW